MKTWLPLTAIAAGVLLAGCATGGNEIALDTVGPAMSSGATASTVSGNGTLLVYSAFRRNADFNSPDQYRQEHSDYDILADDGKVFRTVHNNSGTVLQDAVPVDLPAGKYKVHARANGYGFVDVPIVMVAGQKTILHLEGGNSWPDQSMFNATNAVRLPDGLIIGWKAPAGM